jgi:hypothetical protein
VHLSGARRSFQSYDGARKKPSSGQDRLQSDGTQFTVGDQARDGPGQRVRVLTDRPGRPASPAISGRLVVLLQTTGHPLDMASRTGMPKPSNKDGNTRARRPAVRAGTSFRGTYPESGPDRAGRQHRLLASSAGCASRASSRADQRQADVVAVSQHAQCTQPPPRDSCASKVCAGKYR